MSQHIQHHHPHQPQYVHYSGPPSASASTSSAAVNSSSLVPPPHNGYAMSSGMTMGMTMGNPGMYQPQPQQVNGMSMQGGGQQMHVLHYPQTGMVDVPPVPQQAQQQIQQSPSAVASTAAASGSASATGSTSANGIVAAGDWTKDLVQLAKQAELKKHALTLQLHTAHILSAHATLDAKSKAIQDIREQKNKLDSERARLLKCLQDINADRDKADIAEGTMTRECEDLRAKITHLSDGEYAIAKADVDRLRSELGQEPLPSLQQTLEERSAQYLNDRRLSGNDEGSSNGLKRSAPDGQPDSVKRPRGRPKGSKNKKNVSS